jgi:hypothetical protein
MREEKARRAALRRLNTLARVYVNIFRPERFDEDLIEPEYAMTSRQAFELLSSAFRRNFVDELGEQASLRVLQAATRQYLLSKYILRVALLAVLPVLLYVHGLATGVLLQTLLYLSTRPLAWTNRGRGARIAEHILSYRQDQLGSPRGTRRALRRELPSIPAKALTSQRWKAQLHALLPRDEAVREIALKLADQYDGDMRALLETSVELAR